MAITLSSNNNGMNTQNQGGISLSRNTDTSSQAQPKQTSISLSKGAVLSLSKTEPGLKNVKVGLGWDIKRYNTGDDFDLDASVFMLGENGKAPSNNEFIFYGQPRHISGSVIHAGDNRTGQGDGDDEVIEINLSTIPSNITKIVFTVTIHEAVARKQNFGQVENAYIRIVNQETGVEICRYDLGEDYSVENSLNVAELYKKDNEWRFKGIGAGYSNGLEGFTNDYGVILG